MINAWSDVAPIEKGIIDTSNRWRPDAFDPSGPDPSMSIDRKLVIDEVAQAQDPKRDHHAYGRVQRSQSARWHWQPVARPDVPRWWREIRHYVEGAPMTLAEVDAAQWTYGLAEIKSEYRTVEVDDGANKVKKRIEFHVITRTMTCPTPAGRSVWRSVVREIPIDEKTGEPKHDGEHGAVFRLVSATVAHRVDGAGEADLSASDARCCSQRRLTILRGCLGDDLFSWLQAALCDRDTLEQIGVGRDEKARARSGADRLRTALRRALRVYAAIIWAEQHGKPLDPSWWTGIGYAGAIIQPLGRQPGPANDNVKTAVAA